LSRTVHGEIALTGMTAGSDIYLPPDSRLSSLHSRTDCHLPNKTTSSPEVTERRRGSTEREGCVDEVRTLLSATNVDAYWQPTEEPRPQPLSPFQGLTKHGHETRRSLRRFQSQPQLSTDPKRGRHFSFELGDDRLERFESAVNARPQSVVSTRSSQTLRAELQRASNIPSPVGTLGRGRREEATGRLQTVFARRTDGRRDSRSSVRTAFREPSRNGGQGASMRGRSSVHTFGAVKCAAMTQDDSDDDGHGEACLGPRRLVG